MGRMLGYHDSDELDRPDLNKCPDCGCFFATEECPLCGKVCPEEMRAGNRAAVKKPKRRKNSSGRVQFIPWYHTWWFILIMMFVMPVAGVVLFFTSPYSKTVKIIGAVVGIAYFLLVYMGGIWQLLGLWNTYEGDLVNDDISQEEYVEKCQNMAVVDFYRAGDNTTGDYVTMNVVVKERISDWYAYQEEHSIYYLCYDESHPDVLILVRDCLIDNDFNLTTGDTVTVYGESAGQVTVAKDGTTADLTYPCLYMAYVDATAE